MSRNTFFQELKDRNLFKVASIYAVTAWLIIQIVATTFPIFEFPTWSQRFIVVLLIVGFPVTLVFAWLQEKKAETKEGQIRKNRWIFAASILGLAVLAVVLLQMRNSTDDSAALGKIINNEIVAINVFENRTNDEDLDAFGFMAAEFSSANLRALDVVTIAPEITRQNQERIGVLPNNPEGKVSFVELTGAKYIITGSYYQKQDSILLNTKLSATETGLEVQSFPAIIKPQDEKEAIIEELQQYLTSYWMLKSDDQFPTINIPKYDAYKKYMSCYSYNRDCLEEAIALDPDLFLARVHLMANAINFSRDDSLYFINMEYMKERWENLTLLEKSAFEGVKAMFTKDSERVLDAFEESYRIDPFNYEVIHSFAYWLLRCNYPRESAEYYEKLFEKRLLFQDEIKSWSFYHYVEALNLIQEYQKASDFYLDLTKEERLTAGELTFYYAMESLAQQKKLETIEKLITQRGDLDKDIYIATYIYKQLYPNIKNPFEDRLQSRIDEFEEIFTESFLWHERKISTIEVYYLLEDYEKALEELYKQDHLLSLSFETPFDQFPPNSYWEKLWLTGLLGSIYAHLENREDLAKVMKQLDQLERVYPNNQDFLLGGAVPYLKARIAAVSNEKEQAVHYLKVALDQNAQYGYWNFTFDQDLANLKGYEPFEEMIRPKERILN